MDVYIQCLGTINQMYIGLKMTKVGSDNKFRFFVLNFALKENKISRYLHSIYFRFTL